MNAFIEMEEAFHFTTGMASAAGQRGPATSCCYLAWVKAAWLPCRLAEYDAV